MPALTHTHPIRTPARSSVLASVLVVVVASSVSVGCMGSSKPDFSLLYSSRAVVASRPPVIVIPGVMGSRLRNRETKEEVWPGSLPSLATGASFRALALPVLEPNSLRSGSSLEPSGLFDTLVGRSFYSDLVTALERYGRYRCVDRLEAIDLSTDCVLLAWDWRQDMVDAARLLGRTITRLRMARFDDALRVDIVAHSAGGLVAQYYLRFGDRDVLDSPEPPAQTSSVHEIDRLILIGAPNFGSIAAVRQAMFGKRFPLGRVGAETLATFPGLPSLFPHPDAAWLIETDGMPVDLDLFSLTTWRDQGLGPFAPEVTGRLKARFRDLEAFNRYRNALEANFQRALLRGQRFQRAMAEPLAATAASIHVFGSGCSPTPARCVVETEHGRLRMRAHPGEIQHPLPGIDYRQLLLEPGDGSVTKSSLLGLPSLIDDRPSSAVLPIRSVALLCSPHIRLGSDSTFLDNLLHVLLYRS